MNELIADDGRGHLFFTSPTVPRFLRAIGRRIGCVASVGGDVPGDDRGDFTVGAMEYG
jgi:hypothetical protein